MNLKSSKNFNQAESFNWHEGQFDLTSFSCVYKQTLVVRSVSKADVTSYFAEFFAQSMRIKLVWSQVARLSIFLKENEQCCTSLGDLN